MLQLAIKCLGKAQTYLQKLVKKCESEIESRLAEITAMKTELAQANRILGGVNVVLEGEV